ncbi:MAG: hypothetical protein Q4B12_01500 [Bowdeniella nasicola]|nr:hypothetical protein [Bowdeniella nasicola]
MLQWIALIPAVVLAVAIMWVPGALVGAALRLPSRWVMAAAPTLGVPVVALAAVVAPWMGWRWGWLPLLGMTTALTVLAAIIGLCRLRIPADIRQEREVARIPGGPAVRPGSMTAWLAHPLAPVVALLLVAAYISVALILAIRHPDRLSQSYDAAFHYNTVVLMAQTGNASSLEVYTANPGSTGWAFYPAAWHDVVVLLLPLTGGKVVEATNAMTFAVAAVVWPANMAALARSTFGRSTSAVTLTVAVSAIVPHFPYSLLSFGILYPTVLAMAILPGAIALALRFIRPQSWWERLPLVAAMGAAVVGIALAQTAIVFSFGLFLFVFALVPLVHRSVKIWRANRTEGEPRTHHWWGRLLWPWLVLVAVVVGVDRATWQVGMIRSMRQSSSWHPDTSWNGAFGDVLTLHGGNGENIGLAGVILGLVTLIGLVVALRNPRLRWIGVAHVLAAALYCVARAMADPLRSFLVGVWYSDAYRLTGLLIFTQVLLIALAVPVIYRWLERVVRRRQSTFWLRPYRLGAAAVAVAILTGVVSTSEAQERVWWMFREDRPTALLEPDERAFLRKAAEIIPDGERVANNPWDGSVMLQAIGGDTVLFPHMDGHWGIERWRIAQDLASVRYQSHICSALNDLNVKWVIKMRGKFWPDDPRPYQYRGIDNAIRRHVGEVVLKEGDLQLARITACEGQ